MKDRELWMDKLKEKFENHSEPIPASGWERLEQELSPPVEKKIYPYRKWIVAAAAVIVLALVSSVSLYFLGTPAADEIRHFSSPAVASTPNEMPGVRQPDAEGIDVEPLTRPLVPIKHQRLAKAENIISIPTPLQELERGEETKETPKVVEKQESTEKQLLVEEKQNESEVDVKPQKQPRRPSGKDKLHIPIEKKPTKKGKWAMGLSVGNSGATNTELGSGVPPYMSRLSMTAVTNGITIPNDQTLVFDDGIPYLRYAKEVMNIEHHQPISVGFSVCKNLKKGFSIETGLTYTLLSSDVELADDKQNIEQKLHYLGIPLRANWNFLDKKLVTLYVTGGGMVEKCIYGKLGSEKETVKPLQFSVSGGVGAQLNATKRLGVYVEPGVAYYFKDGSDVETIRKENPFNFNIQAGIRFTY
ncbi:hypothetical protein [Bacteroides reticulotermitis]|uniref:hypothetical protein n=1 Tax=Bacteroides reticulotermitis TaxID=1133319 RepID=UPI003A89A175